MVGSAQGLGWDRFATLAVWLLCLGAGQGCAISIPRGDGGTYDLIVGLVELGHDGRSVHRAVAGLDVRLGGAAPGLGVGWSEVAVMAATRTSAPSEAADEGLSYAPPLGLRWGTPSGQRRLGVVWASVQYEEDPDAAFLYHSYVGLALVSSRGVSALDVGAGRTTVLMIRSTLDAIVELHFDSCAPGRGSLRILRRGDDWNLKRRD